MMTVVVTGYGGTFRATVVDDADPMQQSRLQVVVPDEPMQDCNGPVTVPLSVARFQATACAASVCTE